MDPVSLKVQIHQEGRQGNLEGQEDKRMYGQKETHKRISFLDMKNRNSYICTDRINEI